MDDTTSKEVSIRPVDAEIEDGTPEIIPINVKTPDNGYLYKYGYLKPDEPSQQTSKSRFKNATEKLLSLAGKGSKPDPHLEQIRKREEAKRLATEEMRSIGEACIQAHEYIAPIQIKREQEHFVQTKWGEKIGAVFEHPVASVELLEEHMQDDPDAPLVTQMREDMVQEFNYRNLPWETRNINVSINGLNTDITEVNMHQQAGTNNRVVSYWVERGMANMPIDDPETPLLESPQKQSFFDQEPPRFLIGKHEGENTFAPIGSLEQVKFLAKAAQQKPSEFLKGRGYTDVQHVVPNRLGYISQNTAK